MATLRRVLLITLFLSLASGVFVGGHVYFARRMILDTEIGEPWRTLGLALVVAGAVAIALHPFAERLLPRRQARFVGGRASGGARPHV